MADTGMQWLITDVPEAINKAGDFEPWAKVYTNWEMLDFGRHCCAAALASRPAEVDDWISVEDRLPEIGAEVLVYRPNSERGTVTALARFIRHEGASDFYWDNSYPGKGNMHLDTSITYWMSLPAAPSRTTKKDGA